MNTSQHLNPPWSLGSRKVTNSFWWLKTSFSRKQMPFQTHPVTPIWPCIGIIVPLCPIICSYVFKMSHILPIFSHHFAHYVPSSAHIFHRVCKLDDDLQNPLVSATGRRCRCRRCCRCPEIATSATQVARSGRSKLSNLEGLRRCGQLKTLGTVPSGKLTYSSYGKSHKITMLNG